MPHRVTNGGERPTPGPEHGVLTPALVAAAITLACARVIGAFLRRASELSTGRAPAPRRRLAYVPVHAHDRVHAAVYVGAGGAIGGVEDASDVDDMGLLARAMDQSIRPKDAPKVRASDVIVPVAPDDRSNAPGSDFRAALLDDPEEGDEPVRVLATLTAAAAVLAGVPAIVRPLEPWAPALAAAAAALGAVAWWLSRRG